MDYSSWTRSLPAFPGTERLRAFLALADELHFSRAARRLHLSQPALSQQIAAFEREIGLLLFERSTRSVRLTGAGENLLDVVRSAMNSLNSGLQEVRRRAGMAVGTFTISHSGWGTGRMISHAARVLARTAPELLLLPKYRNFDDEVGSLTRGESDIGLLWRPYSPNILRGLETLSCVHVPVCLVIPEDHRLANHKVVPMDELANEVMLQLPAYWPTLGVKRGLPPTSGYVVGSSFDVYTAVSAGVGVTVCPQTAELENFNSTVRFVQIEDATAELIVAWRPGACGAEWRAAVTQLRKSGRAARLYALAQTRSERGPLEDFLE